MTYEQLMATALRAQSLSHADRGGWMNDLENMRAEDARAFYDTWYAP